MAQRTNDPEPDDRIERGVRYYEGTPDEHGDQSVRIMAENDDYTRQKFFDQVTDQVTIWNAKTPGHRYPEHVERTITAWRETSTDQQHSHPERTQL